MTIECIANNGTNGEPEVPLWRCSCAECTRMEWEVSDILEEWTLPQWRRHHFPNEWGK